MIPSVIVVTVDELERVLIHLQRALKITVQLTLSNAFSVSNDAALVSSFVCCGWFVRLKSLQVLSDACLFLMKPVWSGRTQMGGGLILEVLGLC